MTQTTAEKTNIVIVRKFFEVGPSKGDLTAADALLHPEFSLHTPLPTPGPGIEEMNNVITTCRAAFHGLYVTIDDIMADGDKVIARFTARGTHNGDFMGVSPTGKAITLTAIEIFRVREGKIAELWGEVNLMGLMQQLGMAPGSA
jgi:ketosteroid isomerase-like protein